MEMDFERVITFINELYGSYFKLKEIHWNTYSKSLHLLIDDINDDLLEYVDDITENIMGLNDSRFGYGIINPNIPNTTDPKEILKVLAAKAEYLKSGMTAGRYAGIVNILDDFAQTMNRYVYLSSDR